MSSSPDIFEEVVRLRREGVAAALATIVDTVGSTPGRRGMRLLVLEDGTFLGTVGGGCLEAEVYETARQVLRDETPRTLEFKLTEKDSPDSGLMCGGAVTIFVEPLTTPSLWIFGGGHISKALCDVATTAGFSVTVADDRPAYASPERFPGAARTVAGPYPRLVADMRLGEHTYVVVVTRGHKEDGQVLRELARRFEGGERPRFLGMIGSQAKRAVLFRKLREDGVGEEFLAAVRTPMGVWIGARSHEEIAVSVTAELISVRRLGRDAAASWRERELERRERRRAGREPALRLPGADR